MENPETQAKLGTRHKRSNQEWTIQRHRQQWAPDTEGESRIDNPETQATLVTVPNVAYVSGLSILDSPFCV
jgi:hypothetical protein